MDTKIGHSRRIPNFLQSLPRGYFVVLSIFALVAALPR